MTTFASPSEHQGVVVEASSALVQHRCPTCGYLKRGGRYMHLKRLPFRPLETYLTGRFGTSENGWARMLPVSRTALRAMRRNNRLLIRTGENLADALGVHPTEIWADYYERIG